MTRSEWFTHWSPVVAAVVTVAGGLYLTELSSRETAERATAELKNLAGSVRDSRELRRAVLRPLEGHWRYDLEFDRYFNVETDQDKVASQGVASIVWSDGGYRILLGYANAHEDGTKISVSVNEGSFPAGADGIPEKGTPIEMRYVHRMGASSAVVGAEPIDASRPREDRYHYEIRDYEGTRPGRVDKIYAHYPGQQSSGRVVFTRIR